MLNRDELCRLFLTTVVPVYLILLIWVGGGGPVASLGPDEGELPGLVLPLFNHKKDTQTKMIFLAQSKANFLLTVEKEPSNCFCHSDRCRKLLSYVHQSWT